MSQLIYLTQGKVASVDDNDYRFLTPYSWCTYNPHRRTYYAKGNIGGRVELMHRFILGLRPGDGKQIDHINGDGLDNRRANLRICTQSQNLHNTYKKTGVTKCKQTGKWRASINVEGKTYWLGRHPTREEAQAVVDALKRDMQLI